MTTPPMSIPLREGELLEKAKTALQRFDGCDPVNQTTRPDRYVAAASACIAYVRALSTQPSRPQGEEGLAEAIALIREAKTALGSFSVNSAKKPPVSHAVAAIWKLKTALNVLSALSNPHQGTGS